MKSTVGSSIAIAALWFAQPAQALQIILNDINPNGSSQVALDAFGEAAAIWENAFSDDITVRLDVGFQTLDPGVLGSTGSASIGALYQDTRSALVADALSADDAQAVSTLEDQFTFNFVTRNTDIDPADNGGNASLIQFDSTSGAFGINAVLDINRANAKALGLLGDDGLSDAQIQFSDSFNFDFDRSDGIDANAFDFIGVAAHEIGHALGFVSGVDIIDLVAQPDGPFAGPFEFTDTDGDPGNDLPNFRIFNTLDLFRHSAATAGSGIRDLTLGDLGDQFLSIDGGFSSIAPLSTGRFNGVGQFGGQQASHFGDNLGAGILDPTAGLGEFLEVTAADLLAFDVIGWDIRVPAPAPLSIALLALFGLLRRRA